MPALSILIAEDNAADRMLLSTIVGRQGHRALTASNGLEALSLFEQERPQLVLMDAMMPVMDGFESARRIKVLAGEALVPIIFLTSLSESEALARCLEVGDDFLAKPYNRVILEAKIRAMDRLRRLQDMVLRQRDLIAKHNEHLLNEQRVAKAVFDKVAHSGALNASNIRYMQSPFALFNGDLLLAAFKPSGGMHVLLGDFTGHGLPAAIGAMPMAEMFYAMTSKGFSIAEILREVNAKLKRVLPVGVFCCATLLNISRQRHVVEVWNGGLPNGYLYRGSTGEWISLASRHLPLGVLDASAFNDSCEVYAMSPEDRIYLLSDGVLETSDSQGRMYGEERLLEVFEQRPAANELFDRIQASLAAFRGTAQDDVSMIEIGMPSDEQYPPSLAFSDSGQNSPLDWSADFEFRADTLRSFNPLPYLLQLLLEVRGLRPQGSALYSVLAEMYSNALEHGVLGLESALKQSAEGFTRYYQERRNRLSALQEGYVRFHLCLKSDGERGGVLRVSVEDSGKGFDVAAALQRKPRQDGLCGRGMHLIRELTTNCQWQEDGCGVSVEFRWLAQA
ncbi:SpoIIE family protein phosphatase [Pseudomonas sp. LRF_L74]|uniref:SpoIIE family protein phosphatase n=1 Tax=Pseudomonas sp. LRF_L74 TaxID=3369422 RepID=UPI003F5EF6EA